MRNLLPRRRNEGLAVTPISQIESPPLCSTKMFFSFPMAQQPLVSQGFHIIEASRSHSDTPHSVGLPWTSDQPDAETSLPYNTHPCPQRDSNPQCGKRAGAEPRLRLRGHWDQPRLFFLLRNIIHVVLLYLR